MDKKTSSPPALEKTNYELVFESSGDKEKIILILLQNSITPKEIISLTLANITENGITIRDKEVPVPFEIIAGYLSLKGKFIKKKSGFLFPSIKQAAPMAEANVTLIVSGAAKKHNLKIIDLDLPTLQGGRKKPEKITFQTPGDLIKWIKG